ncbi:MCE family protein [Kibdelosporangium phytohabitans]|uniref:ABC transporter substrate-binding protein n=1 Tax=Kibdelosporangium phytohabitans TaxID=860235 RepID=A0A0N9ICF6_9PSEU|nr:MCE family protein [Kibdelosporangium phytohabitans]ALG12633.1 ABC transporter substrate-binding protein [Kibdelosporangium phytohabitans]MBE1464279.1 phospholipid/cholesterol/gamma-HCH transport system substrate-binding protein [Kibdelosporangium phytohabitans]
MKPLKERNQATVGAVTLALLVLSTLAVFFSDDLPIIGTGTTYSAFFSEAAGLADGNEVQIAGVKVGEVSTVALARDQVRVRFKIRDVRLGDQTRAAIGIRTLLGEKYLALEPGGTGAQDPDQTIPRSRTTTPFDVNTALGELSKTVDNLDTAKLADSFKVVTEALKDTPEHMRGALDGLSALSKTISTRDKALAELLANTGKVSGTLAARNDQIVKLITDGNLLLAEIQRRKDAINQLLRGTRDLSNELRGLVADNRTQLKPTLQQLEKVTAMLQRNQDNLSRGLAALAPFVRISTNTTGNGRWFEGYLCGLLPPYINLGPGKTNGLTINPDGCLPPITGGGR